MHFPCSYERLKRIWQSLWEFVGFDWEEAERVVGGVVTLVRFSLIVFMVLVEGVWERFGILLF